MKPLYHTIASALFLVTCQVSVAQERPPTERERQLEEQIQELMRRVENLEKRLADQEPEQAPPSAEEATPSEQTAPAPEQPPEDLEQRVARIEDRLFKYPMPLDMYWDEGIRFSSPDGNFKFKLGGRTQIDGSIMNANDRIERGRFGFRKLGVGDLDDGVEFRRARVYMEGQIYDDTYFKAEYDFAGGDANFKDVFIGIKNLPVVGNIMAGHFKEPFSLDELTSSRFITFMERGLGNDALVPGRNTGIALHNTAFGERLTWQAGVFVRSDSFGDGEFDNGYDWTGRVTGLLWYQDEGAELLHLGFAASLQNYEGDRSDGQHMVRFRQRPEDHQAPYFVDTGQFYAESSNLIGAEAAWVHGPLSVQGEYLTTWVNGVGDVWGHTPNPIFKSFYVFASYFLTGEHRKYKKTFGVFDRVEPLRDFGKDGGWGAWEVAARYSLIDLDDDGIDGGELHDFTFGLNWYLNPNLRMMFNYVYSDLEDSGNANLFSMRLQVDF